MYTENVHKTPSTDFIIKRNMHLQTGIQLPFYFIGATRDMYVTLPQCSIGVVRGLGLDVRCTE